MPVPGCRGRLWLCGKHFIAPDPEGVLERLDASTIVCLNERHELDDRYPDYVDFVRQRHVWSPIPDLGAPSVADARSLARDVLSRLRAGGAVVLHCGAGIGRAGTIAVAVLVEAGVDLERALQTVADSRPLAGPEAGAQQALLEALVAG